MNNFRMMDVVIDMSAPWDAIEAYRIDIVGPPMSVHRADEMWGRPVDLAKDAVLFADPFRLNVLIEEPTRHHCAMQIRDLASAFIRSEGMTPEAALHHIRQKNPVSNQPSNFIEGVLRCCVANGFFEATTVRHSSPILRLSDRQKAVEEYRVFAASFADELQSLSERIRGFIRHPAIVGSYRENLLQSLLKKNLPERYHVATGFVMGCSRQIDILIYDRIDYAPLFREGDLVVLPRQAVRAVIEVKTRLTAKEIRSSLDLISEVAKLDDYHPPFFKAVFAFESEINAQTIAEKVVQYHTGSGSNLYASAIHYPYEHVSCICVLKKYFTYVDYAQGVDRRWMPKLIQKESASGLSAHAAYFMQMLLSYLQLDTLKVGAGRELEGMLGEDTRDEFVGDLATAEGWGPYYRYDSGIEEDRQEIDEVASLISHVRRWLNGAQWDGGPSKLQRGE